MSSVSFLENPWVLLLIVLWVLPWKGWALWRAARSKHLRWFIVLLVLNTLAILDIIYIFFFSREKRYGEKRRGGAKSSDDERVSAKKADGAKQMDARNRAA